MGVLHLDDALAQPHQVGTDPDGTTGHLGTHKGTPGVTGAAAQTPNDFKSQQEKGEEQREEGPQLYHADGHYFVIGTGGLSSNGTSSSQVFHPKSVVLPNDVQQDIPAGKVEPWCGKHSPA